LCQGKCAFALLNASRVSTPFSAGASGALPPERGCAEDQPQQLRKTSLLEYA
jgi:hypothetical protein